jgi:dipeptidyl aminopeptidase/acylaminoacyl peptidase
MFVNDENGDENQHLFVADPRSGELRDLTPFANTRANPWHDVFLIDSSTGQRSLVWEKRQEFAWVGLDWQLQPRHARSNAADGGSRLWRIDGETVTHWLDVPFDANLTTGIGLFDARCRRLCMWSSVEHDKSALLQVDWSNGEKRVLFQCERADVSGAIFNARTFEPEAVCVDAGRQEWTALTPDVAPDLTLIKERLPGHDFHVQSQTDDNRRWILMSYTAEQPATYHLLDRDRQTLTELFTARPELKPYRLAPMHAVEGKSRDGLTLMSYFTLPANIEGDRPPQPLPMVLVVHGGRGRAISTAFAATISGWRTAAMPFFRSIIAARPVLERRSLRKVKKSTRARCMTT